MPEQQQKIGAEFLKRFVRQVCITIRRHENAEVARDELKNQIRKVKLASISQKKWLVDKEIASLEGKIDYVLKREAALMGIGRTGNFEIRELKKSLETLQSRFNKEISERQTGTENLDSIKRMVHEMSIKIDRLVDDKVRKERRLHDIEQKIIKRKSLRDNTREMEKKLHELEESYKKIKHKSPGYDTKRLEDRINFIKSRLASMY